MSLTDNYLSKLVERERRIRIKETRMELTKREYPFLPYSVLKSGNTTKNIRTLEENNVPVENIPPHTLGINPQRFKRNLETWISYNIPTNRLTNKILKFTSQESLEIYLSKNFPEYVKKKFEWDLEEEIRKLLNKGETMYEIKSKFLYVDPLTEAEIAMTAIGEMRKKKIGKKRIMEELLAFGFSEPVLDSVFGKSFLIKILKEQKIKNPEKVAKGLEEALIQEEDISKIPLYLSRYRIPFEKSIPIVQRLKDALG